MNPQKRAETSHNAASREVARHLLTSYCLRPSSVHSGIHRDKQHGDATSSCSSRIATTTSPQRQGIHVSSETLQVRLPCHCGERFGLHCVGIDSSSYFIGLWTIHLRMRLYAGQILETHSLVRCIPPMNKRADILTPYESST